MFSYFDLAEAAKRVAVSLAGAGGSLDEARVAYLVPPSFAAVVVPRGIWLAGGVAVPLAVSHPPPELEHVVRDSGASIVIGSGRSAEALEAIAAACGARFLRTPDLLAGEFEGQVCEPAPTGGQVCELTLPGSGLRICTNRGQACESARFGGCLHHRLGARSGKRQFRGVRSKNPH